MFNVVAVAHMNFENFAHTHTLEYYTEQSATVTIKQMV